MVIVNANYQAVQVGPLKLEVKAPTEASVWLYFGLAAVMAFFFLYRMYNRRSLYPALGALLFAGPLTLVGFNTLKSGNLMLDRQANTAVIYHPTLLWNMNETIPLDHVQYAKLDSMSVSTYITLVLRGSDAETFAYSNDEAGKEKVVSAINQFLKRPGR